MKKVSCYQRLVRKQILALKRSREALSPLSYLIYASGPVTGSSCDGSSKELGYCYEFTDITKDGDLLECLPYVSDLVNEGVLIELERIDGISVYTTLHADLVFRVLRGRAFEDDLDGRWVGYYDIDVEESYLPDFSAVNIEKLREVIANALIREDFDREISARAAEAIINGLRRAGYRSLAVWQFEAIRSILEDSESFYVVDAPTAAGKTLVFMVPAVVYAIISKLGRERYRREDRGGALLAYPRKALQRQQLENLLKVLHYVNESLKDLNVRLTVAVDKGVEERREEIRGGESELLEIDLGELRGRLIQRRETDGRIKVLLRCLDGRELELKYFIGLVVEPKDRDYILMQHPDILITNPWTIRERIKSSKAVYREQYIKRSLIVLDEAHVYTNVNYLELVAALKLYRSILNENKARPKYILSSATILLESKSELARWIWGICKDPDCRNIDVDPYDVKLLDYFKLEPSNPNTLLKVSVTLLPYRLSIETIVQGVLQVLATALTSRSLKSIVFVDSVSEVSTLMKYVKTIFHDRSGVEICDHILSIRCRDHSNSKVTTDVVRKPISGKYGDYSWSHLWGYDLLKGSYTIDRLLESIRNSLGLIREHHGALTDDLRREIEQGFAADKYKILIATSTLDLGVDFGDVTFVVQYKPPSSDEALIQRLGRAGRSDKSYRVALAFYIPLHTPIHLQALARGPRPSGIVLPHISVVNKMYTAEILEYKVKENLRESLHYVREISPGKARRIALYALQEPLNELVKSGRLQVAASYYTYLKEKVPDYRELCKGIGNAKKRINKLLAELKSKCRIKKSGIGAGKLLAEYVKLWLEELSEILDKYKELHAGLGMLSDSDADRYLKDFNNDINEWIKQKPAVDIDESRVCVYTPYVYPTPISDLIKPEECIDCISKLYGEIELLIKYVKSFVSKVESGRELITVLFEVFTARGPREFRLQCPDKVSVDSLDCHWYHYIRDDVLKYLRLYLGLASRGQADVIRLQVMR